MVAMTSEAGLQSNTTICGFGLRCKVSLTWQGEPRTIRQKSKRRRKVRKASEGERLCTHVGVIQMLNDTHVRHSSDKIAFRTQSQTACRRAGCVLLGAKCRSDTDHPVCPQIYSLHLLHRDPTDHIYSA